MSTATTRTKLTPAQIASQWGVGYSKVITWIRSGELRAINVAARSSRKPQFLVDAADLADFELRRRILPPLPGTRQRRKLKGIEQIY